MTFSRVRSAAEAPPKPPRAKKGEQQALSVNHSQIKPKQSKPIFDLYRHGLTQGSIATWLNCRCQFTLKYVEGWTAKEFSSAISFGIAFHDVLARVQTEDITPEHAVDEFEQRTIKQSGKLTAKQRDALSLQLGTVEILCRHYLQRWPEKFIWVEREKKFFVYNNEQRGKKVGENLVPLTGRRDGVFRRKEGGPLYLLETKTKGNIDEEGIQTSLIYDLQTMLYLWSIRHEFDQEPKGVCYDVVRRPGLKFTGSYRSKPETLKDYFKRLEEDVANHKAEDGGSYYFYRWEVELSPGDLDHWIETQLNPILADIEDWWANRQTRRDYLNPAALYTRYGRCELFDPLVRGDYSQFYRRKIVYAELED